jgi:hypothetical protein
MPGTSSGNVTLPEVSAVAAVPLPVLAMLALPAEAVFRNAVTPKLLLAIVALAAVLESWKTVSPAF